MIEVAVMIEGQDGLSWPLWRRVAEVAEGSGFAGLYRSDHFVGPDGPYKDALELWTSLTWLADNTERIEFGPLVSPVSFRHPVITAWQAGAVDRLSGGRLRLGLGAGWQRREHEAFGFDLLGTERRFARFAEGLEVITALLRSGGPASFSGDFYRLDGASISPRGASPSGPPVVIGGNGERRTLPLVARYADEWNAVFIRAERFRELSERLDALLEESGREPRSVRRTLMTRAVYGRDEREVERLLGGRERGELQADGLLVGTAEEILAGLRDLEAAGVERVMLQWLDTDDLERLEDLGREILPELGA